MSPNPTTNLVGAPLGDGMGATSRFISEFIAPLFGMEEPLEDSHRTQGVNASNGLVLTTDVFVVDPLEFPGGDIGTLAVSGVINDLLASGGRPCFITLSVLVSEHLDRRVLERCLTSLATLAETNGARVVCGDTKAHPFRQPELALAVTAVGLPMGPRTLSLADAQPGDDLWITGPLGDHSIAVISAREGLGFEGVCTSDCSPLLAALGPLVEEGRLHAMRDLTRGGLLSAAHDGVAATGRRWHLREVDIPVRTSVRAAAEMLGLDVMALTNEGSMLLAAPPWQREAIAAQLARFPQTAEGRRVGYIAESSGDEPVLELGSGEMRLLTLPDGLGVPRLC